MPFFLIFNLSVSQGASSFLSGNLPFGPEVPHCGPVGEEELVVHIQGRHYWNSFVIRKTWAALINDMKKKCNGVSYFPLIKSTFITGLVLLRIKKR